MARILIVDDSRFMRMVIKKMCLDTNHQVIGEASNGKEGVELFFRLMPDLVTMDITMPELNGIQAVKHICSRDPKARIIICSALGQQHLVIEAIENGAKDFVVKPFDKTKLNDSFYRALNR